MPSQTQFYLNGSRVNPPKNWQALALELNFDLEEFKTVLSTNSFDFVRENADYLNQWRKDGLNGGPGVFEGVPLKIEITNNGVIDKPFDGYLDLSDGAKFSCVDVQTNAKEVNIDWLNDKADSLGPEYLFAIGEITTNDFIYNPYILNSVPNYRDAAIMTLSVYVIGRSISDAVKDINNLVSEIGNPFQTVTAAIKAILLVAYLLLLIIALIKLINDLINLIIQPVKYHAGMMLKTTMQKCCAHFGLTLKSDIFDDPTWSQLELMPEKLYNPQSDKDSRLLGFLQPNSKDQKGYYKGTFGDLLRALKLMFKAKIIITSNMELVFIRQDKNISTATYTLADIYQPEFTLNTEEFISNYLIAFQTDLSDKNTIQNYLGNEYQVTVRPQRIANTSLVLLKHLTEVDIPFARATRKTSLTVPEQIFKVLLDAFSPLINGIVSGVNLMISALNAIIKTINKIVKALKVVGIHLNWNIKPISPLQKQNLGATIENRIGMLMLENDDFNIPKIFILQKGSSSKFNKVDGSNLLSAKNLYNQFHFITSFVPSVERPNANQYFIKEYTNVPFCFEDFETVKTNNKIFSADGTEATIESLKWNPYDQLATSLIVRFNKLYTNNLFETFIEPDGS